MLSVGCTFAQPQEVLKSLTVFKGIFFQTGYLLNYLIATWMTLARVVFATCSVWALGCADLRTPEVEEGVWCC